MRGLRHCGRAQVVVSMQQQSALLAHSKGSLKLPNSNKGISSHILQQYTRTKTGAGYHMSPYGMKKLASSNVMTRSMSKNCESMNVSDSVSRDWS